MPERSGNYFLIEIANTHGGDFSYLNDLADRFSDMQGNFGIKFQAFHPDLIATPDFRAHELYQRLHFVEAQWAEVIKKAAIHKDVWLDIFDVYGAQIFQQNRDQVSGIKFQSSVLYNYELLDTLATEKLSGKKLILNVAGHPVEGIQSILTRIENLLAPEEILLEFGFQAYPTSLGDSGISKIEILKKNFKNRLVFADHVDGASDDAITLPIAVSMLGVDFFEKHVMLDDRETEFDHFSSLTPDRFREMVHRVEEYTALTQKPFTNEAENTYLKKTLMKPVLARDLQDGDIPNLKLDFKFRRANEDGLSVPEIEALLDDLHVLSRDVKAGEILQREDFRKARIGIAVVCRMKSTRLPQKALKKIGDLTSVEYCLMNLQKLEYVDQITLATSTLEDDAILKDYTYAPEIDFHQGHPEDVMQRIVDVVKKHKLDIVSRVTADMPIVFKEVYERTLKAHFRNSADFTKMVGPPLGSATSIMSANALVKAKSYFPTADYSEYLIYYFTNNPHLFRISEYQVPPEYVADFRMTLDYEEDLEFFNAIEDQLAIIKNPDVAASEILKFLQENPDIAGINKGQIVKYHSDKDLIEKINKHTTLKTSEEE